MINTIFSAKGIVVNGATSYAPSVSGALWWDGASRQLKVFDGYSHISLTGDTCEVSLSPDVLEIIEWAAKKRGEEKAISELAADHPGVKALLDERALVDAKLSTMAALVKEHK